MDKQTQIPSVLQRIIETKKTEVLTAKSAIALSEIKRMAEHQKNSGFVCRGFAQALQDKQMSDGIAIIAEVKKASPSKGVICHSFCPTTIAQQYQKAGAACLSVLTDTEYFQGHDDYLKQVKQVSDLPILRKDFMIDEYQIYQSYVLGADCILLIMACLDDETLYHLHEIAIKLGMDVLIEIHTEQELERALALPLSENNLYGINNRDLNTFKVDLQNTIRLKNHLVASLQKQGYQASIVTESGIHGIDDIRLMKQHGIESFLIGEQFMKTANAGETLSNLLALV